MPISLGDRMKEYENISRIYLPKRTPVIIRLDGKSFHNFTRGFKKPFDDNIADAMIEATKVLMKNIQGAQCAYLQSDEISILVTDYRTFDTQAWFDYNIQKIASISASLLTISFNMSLMMLQLKDGKTLDKNALFDSRCFSLSKEEVANYFLWRQQDCIRNSISAVAQANFSTSEIYGKNGEEMKAMLLEKGINYDKDILPPFKYGVFIDKEYVTNTAPDFKEEGREMIEKILKEAQEEE